MINDLNNTGTAILLFGTMGNIGPTVLAHLQGLGLRAALVDFPQNTFRDEAGYRRALLKAIGAFDCGAQEEKKPRSLTIIPIGNPIALSHFAPELRERFPWVRPVAEQAEKVELLDSKLSSYNYFRSIGITVPERFNSPDDVPEGTKTVFKRDVSFAAQGVRIPGSIQGLRNLVKHQGADGRYMIQRFIEGREYSVDIFRAEDGRCTASSYTRSAKEITMVSMPGIERIGAKVLESLDYHGICGFDFIVSTDGVPFLLEANPRLTGGIGAQISSGHDFPALLLK